MSQERGFSALWIAAIALGVAMTAVTAGYLVFLRHEAAQIARQPMRPPPGGTLIICGGGTLPDEVTDRFVELAGGPKARLIVIPSFDPSPKDVARLLEPWRKRGVASVALLHAARRAQCDDAEFVRPLADATGVWISGGEQSRLAETYVATEVERQLKALLERGGVVGGSSAGAAAMTRVMIASGLTAAVQQHGFDLLPGVVIDQHFLRRNRLQRLLGVLSANPGLIGLGIDEHTAVQIEQRGRYWSVIGKSYAMVCLPEDGKFPRIEILKPGDRTNIEALKQSPGAYAIGSPGDLERFLEGEGQR